jgi:hypothetical protein
MFSRVVLMAALVGGCSTAGVAPYLTLRTVGETRQMGAEADGSIVGSQFQLRPTAEGYWGVAGNDPVDLISDGERIVGEMGSHLVSLRLHTSGDVMRLEGLFGRLVAHLEVGPTLSSWFGGCYYVLHRAGSRLEGERSCRLRVNEPVTIERSAEFDALPVERRAMLLALLLGD